MIKKCIMSTFFGGLSSQEIRFMVKIRNIFRRGCVERNTLLAREEDYFSFIKLLDDIYRLAVDMQIDKQCKKDKVDRLPVESQIVLLLDNENVRTQFLRVRRRR